MKNTFQNMIESLKRILNLWMQTLSAVLSVVDREQCCSDIRVEAMLYWSTPGVSSCRRCAKNFPKNLSQLHHLLMV